jgi:N-acetylglucosamine kinase-like BadF-type ATPase
MPQIAVGVDAGGTKTAVVRSIDRVPGPVIEREGASASLLGAETAAALIADAVENALEGAHPHAIFVGAAGAGNREVSGEIERVLQARYPSACVSARDDAYVALRAGVPEGDGVVLVAGTGAIAYAQHGERGERCGGYGYLFGESGSGFAIGAAGIRHLLHAYDGRAPRDDLAAAIETYLHSESLESSLFAIYRDPHRVAAVANAAAIVLDLARSGERSAAKIVQSAALDLAAVAGAVIKKADLIGSDAPIVLAGSLLVENTLLSYLLETRLLNEHPQMPVSKLRTAPCFGALALAQRLIA